MEKASITDQGLREFIFQKEAKITFDTAQELSRHSEKKHQIRQVECYQRTCNYFDGSTDEESLDSEDRERNNFPKEYKLGLYILGRCQHIECQNFPKRLWIHKGTGNINLNKICATSLCPSCNEIFEDIDAAAIYGINYDYQGQKINGDKVYEKINFGKHHSSVFPKLSNWIYLKIKI